MEKEKLGFEILLEKFSGSLYEYISFDEFKLVRLDKSKVNEDEDEPSIPFENLTGKGIIVKTIFEEIEGVKGKVAQKTFYYYDEDIDIDKNLSNIQKMDKKSITKLLKDSLITYIKKENQLTNSFKLTKKRETKAGKVTYEMIFSDFISFILPIEPKELDTDDVSLYILELPKKQVTDEEITKPESDNWKLEYAKSSRASCKACGDKILKDTIRLGQPSYFQQHLSYKWHHIDCKTSFKPEIGLIGLDDLSEDDISDVRKKLGLLSSSDDDLDPKDVIEIIIQKFADTDGLTLVGDVYKEALKKNISEKDIESILKEFEEEGKLYYPETDKINLI